MARWVKGDKYDKRAAKHLRLEDRRRADRFLEKLSETPPDTALNLKPMEGHNGELWEMKAGGQNRFILRRVRDDQGGYFVVEDVGPHDIYKGYNKRR
ncbi:hypothetical protein [uncultured Rhodospira sp.]|uniref:hypothetical protein n=1 Tax=uncultured Rhodospira sp. TaxID=1936189 RepID=UPI00261D24C5|nr:hypothetical protein [uncultured Rhodospira sp.]